MSNAQRLYNMGVISLDECCNRLMLIRSMPTAKKEPPRFLRIHRAPGNERTTLAKIKAAILPDLPISDKNIRVKGARGGFTVVFFYAHKQFSYPGRFESQTAAVAGVKYMVYAINNEIERRAKKLPARTGSL